MSVPCLSGPTYLSDAPIPGPSGNVETVPTVLLAGVASALAPRHCPHSTTLRCTDKFAPWTGRNRTDGMWILLNSTQIVCRHYTYSSQYRLNTIFNKLFNIVLRFKNVSNMIQAKYDLVAKWTTQLLRLIRILKHLKDCVETGYWLCTYYIHTTTILIEDNLKDM